MLSFTSFSCIEHSIFIVWLKSAGCSFSILSLTLSVIKGKVDIIGFFQDLTNTPHSPYLTLLNIFAFGTFKNLSESAEPLPEVTEAMSRKLRLLTVVSLAETSKVLASYWCTQIT